MGELPPGWGLGEGGGKVEWAGWALSMAAVLSAGVGVGSFWPGEDALWESHQTLDLSPLTKFQTLDFESD